MSSEYTYDAGMRHNMNRTDGIGCTNRIGPTHYPLGELRDTLAVMLACVFKIFGPRIEHRAIKTIPSLPFPCAEIELLQTWIGLNGTECFGQQAASAQRTRVPDTFNLRHFQQPQTPLQQTRRIG